MNIRKLDDALPHGQTIEGRQYAAADEGRVYPALSTR